MKKRSLLLVLLASTLLVGCKKEETPPPPPPTLGGFVIGEDVVNGNFVNDNIVSEEEVEVEEEVNRLVTKKVGSITVEDKNVLAYNEGCGVLALKNEEGYVGFYSLTAQKYLISPRYVPEWLSFDIIKSDEVGFFLNVLYEGVTTIYDSLGNVLVETEVGYVPNEAIETIVANDIIYVRITTFNILTNEVDEVLKYKYSSETGKVEAINDIDYDIALNTPVVEDETPEFPFGSKYNEVVDLTNYGLNLKLAISGQNHTVFDTSGNKKCSFTIPYEARYAFVGDKIYYQISNTLPEDALNYDYSEGNEKYSLETYAVNLETGEITEKEISAVIYWGEPVLNSSSTAKFSKVDLAFIDDNKALGAIRTYLIDSDEYIRDDISSLVLNAFEKVGSNYFNHETGILFDSNLNEIAYIGGCNPEVVEGQDLFIGEYKGKYGLLDFNGKVVMEFEWDELKLEFQNNCLIAIKGDNYYRYDILTGTETLLGNDLFVSEANDNLYIVEDPINNYYHLESISARLESVERENSFLSVDVPVKVLLANSSQIILAFGYEEEVYNYETESYEYVDSYKYVTYEINPMANSETFAPIGTELTDEIVLGLGRDDNDYIELELGEENKFHYNVYTSAYYTYTVETTGYYTFEFDNELYVEAWDETYTTIELDYDLDAYYNGGSYVGTTREYLEEGDVIYLLLRNPYHTYGNYLEFTFKMEDGSDINYPRVYSDDLTLDFTNSEMLYVLYEAKYDAVYDLDVADTVANRIFIDEYNNTSTLEGPSEYTLEKNTEYKFQVVGSSVDSTHFTLEVSDNQVEGESLFSAIELSKTETNAVTKEYNKITNASTASVDAVDKVYGLTFNGTFGYEYYKVTFYDNEKEMIRQDTVYAGDTVFVPVGAEGTAYFEIETVNYSLDQLTIDVTTYEIEESPLENVAQKTLATTDGIKVIEMEITEDELGELTLQSTFGANAMLIDKDGNVLLDQIASDSLFTSSEMIMETGTYYFIVSNDENSDVTSENTVKLAYNKVSTLPLTNVEAFNNYLSGDESAIHVYTNNNNYAVQVEARFNGSGQFYFGMKDGEYETLDYSYGYGPVDFVHVVEPGETIYFVTTNMSSSYSYYYTISVEFTQVDE